MGLASPNMVRNYILYLYQKPNRDILTPNEVAMAE